MPHRVPVDLDIIPLESDLTLDPFISGVQDQLSHLTDLHFSFSNDNSVSLSPQLFSTPDPIMASNAKQPEESHESRAARPRMSPEEVKGKRRVEHNRSVSSSAVPSIHSPQSAPGSVPKSVASRNTPIESNNPFPFPYNATSSSLPSGYTSQMSYDSSPTWLPPGAIPQSLIPPWALLPPLAIPPSSGPSQSSGTAPQPARPDSGGFWFGMFDADGGDGSGTSAATPYGHAGPSTALEDAEQSSPNSGESPVGAEDKRRRNTAASARFRIKKKQRMLNLERAVTDLEGRANELEKETVELRRENGWLREMVLLKGQVRSSSSNGKASGKRKASSSHAATERKSKKAAAAAKAAEKQKEAEDDSEDDESEEDDSDGSN